MYRREIDTWWNKCTIVKVNNDDKLKSSSWSSTNSWVKINTLWVKCPTISTNSKKVWNISLLPIGSYRKMSGKIPYESDYKIHNEILAPWQHCIWEINCLLFTVRMRQVVFLSNCIAHFSYCSLSSLIGN
jgi:hypothetical protein